MAGHTGYITDHNTTKLGSEAPYTEVDFQDGEAVASGSPHVLRPVGTFKFGTPGAAGTQKLRYAKTDASDIGGFRKLTSVGGRGILNTRSAVAGTGVKTLIEEYATDAGDMDGVEINSITDFDWRVQAKRSGSSERLVIEVRAYHRTSGGSETLLATDETNNLTASWDLYTGTIPSFSQSFGTDERLVMKYYVYNKGEEP